MMSIKSAKVKPSSPNRLNGLSTPAALAALVFPICAPSDGVSTASSVGEADSRPPMLNPFPVYSYSY